MKIQLISDLHLETRLHADKWKPLVKSVVPASGSEDLVLVVAGDLCPMVRDHEQLAKYAFNHWAERYKNVIYIPGNHEYYNSSPRKVEKSHNIKKNIHRWVNDINLLCGSEKIRFLDTKVIDLDGVKILGGTMWGSNICDQDFIPELNTFNVKEQKVFLSNLRRAQPDIVISHHLPSTECINEMWKDSIHNAHFVVDLTKFLRVGTLPGSYAPKLWLHGHTHQDVNVNVGNTKVCANPCGYPNEAFGRVWDPHKAAFEYNPKTGYLSKTALLSTNSD
jgi:UDP-2,3-diacylglucosamine pyrophosphatase LpxH